MERYLRLNLGSGLAPIPGFVNVDVLDDLPQVDVVADIGGNLPFEDASAELIYASHLLEHFPTAEVPGLLCEWRRILTPGGMLLLAVPNLEVIARTLVDRPGWFISPHNPWLGAIYGGQKDPYDFHKTGFTPLWLAALLREADFGEVTQVERFAEIGLGDGSHSSEPFGRNVSLNMRAIAGSRSRAPVSEAGPLERVLNPIERLLSFGMRISTRTRSELALRRHRRSLEAVDDELSQTARIGNRTPVA